MNTDRINKAVERFETESGRLAERVAGLDDRAATAAPESGAWNAAQIAWHLALSNDLFTGIVSGALPFAAPAGADFSETFSFATIPSKVKTFPQLEPPADASRDQAVTKLRESTTRLSAALRGLPEERWGYAVTVPFGTLSMYQFAEFAAAHVSRHLAQVERTVNKP